MEADTETRRMAGAYGYWGALYAACAFCAYLVTKVGGSDAAERLADSLGAALIPMGAAILLAALLKRSPAMVRRSVAAVAALVVVGLMYLGGRA